MNSKKKIGIITYWESNDNYGQQLQCWALQHYLCEHGYYAFLIRQYGNPSQWVKPTKKGIKRIKQWIKDSIAWFLYTTNLAYKPSVYSRFSFFLDKDICLRQFPRFRKRNLKMTTIYDSPEKLIQNPPQADIYITGSDQIWNYVLAEEPLKNYFLQFVNNGAKCIAYAPSIGRATLPEEIAEKYKVYLQRFSAISVREKGAISLIAKLGYKVEHVLDPTMMLNAEDYRYISNSAKGKSCVFIYSMNYSSADDVPFDDIKQFATKRNLPIVVTPGSGFVPARELFDGVEYSYATIPQWIQHIAHAELVVTASFHGIVFAILFHRPFVFTPIIGERADRNGRILDLLGDLDLNHRIMKDKSMFNEIVLSEINWEQVDSRLMGLRKKSLDYLLTAIEA